MNYQPVVVLVLLGSNGPDENEKQFPEVFKAFVVTCAINMASHSADAKARDGVTELFVLSLSNKPLAVLHSKLVSEQRADTTLKELFQVVLPVDEVKNHAHGYFIQNTWQGLLWRSYLSDCCALQISQFGPARLSWCY